MCYGPESLTNCLCYAKTGSHILQSETNEVQHTVLSNWQGNKTFLDHKRIYMMHLWLVVLLLGCKSWNSRQHLGVKRNWLIYCFYTGVNYIMMGLCSMRVLIICSIINLQVSSSICTLSSDYSLPVLKHYNQHSTLLSSSKPVGCISFRRNTNPINYFQWFI